MVSVDDSDKNSHCEDTNCGSMFPNIIAQALASSVITQRGILAIGVNGVRWG